LGKKSVFTVRYQRLKTQLLQARTAAGITQVDLAARLGRPQSFVSKYERGERRLDLIEFLEVCDALEIKATDILEGL